MLQENITPNIMDEIAVEFIDPAKKINTYDNDLPALPSHFFILPAGPCDGYKDISPQHTDELVLPWLPPVLVEHAGNDL